MLTLYLDVPLFGNTSGLDIFGMEITGMSAFIALVPSQLSKT